MPRYYTARESANLLGVSLNTLYAYVSRGMIRSEMSETGKRTRRYRAQDVDMLATKHAVRKSPDEALKDVTDWGAPILDSAITSLGEDDYYYRGKSVTNLAEDCSFEEVVDLLWKPSLLDNAVKEFNEDVLSRNLNQKQLGKDMLMSFLSELDRMNYEDPLRFAFKTEATAKSGANIIETLLRIITGEKSEKPVFRRIADALGCDDAVASLIEKLLILAADHELNISSFTARCTASAGCSPYAAVGSAAYAFFGRRHGGTQERVGGMLHEADGRGSLYEVIESRIRRGDSVPGFGHRIYSYDPRAKYILKRLPDKSGFIREAMAASETLLKDSCPNIDFASVMMEREFLLPESAGISIFFLGRIVGWVAHIMEQYEQNRPIRPRARYIGPVIG